MHPASSLPILVLFIVGGIPCLIRASADWCEQPKSCGRVANISYPFWLRDQKRPNNTCGSSSTFQLSCEGDLLLMVNSYYPFYYVHDIFYHNKTFWVKLNTDNKCPIPSYNISALDHPGQFKVSAKNRELFFFRNCSASPPHGSRKIPCASNETFAYLGAQYGSEDSLTRPPACNITVAPVLFNNGGEEHILGLLKIGFLVEWTEWSADCMECFRSGGRCRNDSAFMCICSDGRHERRSCRRRPSRKNLAIGIAVGGSGVLFVFAVLLLSVQKRSKSRNTFLKKKSRNTQSIKDFLNEYGSLAPKRYRYSDLKNITKSFRKKLGEGGYGSVFEGKLQDGRSVAVKILNKSREDGAEFINEVASIVRTSHVNIVTLLGFCLDGSKQALVYEYMPNGSLDKYIYSDEPKALLPWDKLYQIAIGIARGLEYLHRGCNTRIVHFDIKPHNILLNEDFCPKISDFGLAKLCPQRESLLSMAGARGTIGYIAPEVVSRCFGVVSTKSDVYSYGMMVLEMAGGRRNVKAGADRSSEVYFPHWVYEHLDRDGDLEAYDVTVETEEIAKKMILVGLWCVQTAPADRPSMSRVVEMLEGRVTDVERPPKPYPSSPKASVVICPLPRVTDSS